MCFVAALLHKAIGDRLTCVFVDAGLLRWQEGDQVMAMFAAEAEKGGMGIKVIRVNAADRYFQALAGVSDPEAKRKIIGRLFVEIFEEESAKLSNVKWLAQGMRSVFLPQGFAANEVAGSWQLPQTALILAVWTVAGLVLCLRTFRWQRRDAT